MYQYFPLPNVSISDVKQFALRSVVVFCLAANPYLAQAEQNAEKVDIQTGAALNAQELGGVIGNDHWTRIEFSKTYIYPVVVVEPSTVQGGNAYVVGIRNVDASGFEINLKGCDGSINPLLQEEVNYSVVDNDQLSSAGQADTRIRQYFAWGECPV